MSSLAKLIEIASPPLGDETPVFSPGQLGDAAAPLDLLYAERNGFVAFENALLVLPFEASNGAPTVVDWNAGTSWRRHYPFAGTQVAFFAMDAFCGQYGITSNTVVKLEPETGELAAHSENLESWASKMLGDYDFETGWSVAREWQGINGPLQLTHRFLGRTPFVLGGDYMVENLVAVESYEAMERLGSLSKQIRQVPDGEQITLRGWVT